MAPKMRLSTRLWLMWQVLRGTVIRAEADIQMNLITLSFENNPDLRRRLQR